jgi:RNA polymerase sigma-70 factor, ECF subfamily
VTQVAPILQTKGERARVGDQRSSRERLERMFRDHHEVIWRLFRRMGFEADASSDLTQQVFLIAAERLSDIRPPSERAFLFGTALRLSRTAWRKQRRVQLDDAMDQYEDKSLRPEELTDQRRAIELVDGILGKMAPDLLAVFVLFELEGFSTPEIARDLDIPVGTAASRLRRAREVFRNKAARAEQALRKKVGT